ncbi:CsbD family protein [Pseudonocardia sp. H11422]|uniref:CsbD family protein n=1 Tax=Pseudonocardia sp. H11422 TaxID=2835866 RepID=UPI001BDC2AE9|nr:CsbD family protein [Pseudonocardia sp. H11422]
MSLTDKAKNRAQEMSGKAKAVTGEATDDRELQAEGKKDQFAGSIKQAGEKAKDAFKKS